jgi:hypothetical protein
VEQPPDQRVHVLLFVAVEVVEGSVQLCLVGALGRRARARALRRERETGHALVGGVGLAADESGSDEAVGDLAGAADGDPKRSRELADA